MAAAHRQHPILAANVLRQILTRYAQLQPFTQQQAANHFNLEHIQSLMHAHLHESIKLDEFAESVSLSKYHFVKKYKALTTTSIRQISDIASAVGYDDAYYFSRLFKKTMGISPYQYRRLRIGGGFVSKTTKTAAPTQ